MYPYLLALAIAASLLWLGLVEPVPGAKAEQAGRVTTNRIEASLAALVGGLAFSRLSFAALHVGRFHQSPLAALAFWQGGLTAWGAAFGALTGLVLYCRAREIPFWPTADSVATATNIIALSLWLVCLSEGCAYGRSALESALAFAGPDLVGTVQPRWPTQSIGALVSIGLLAVSYFGGTARWRSGSVSLLVWNGHGLLLLGLSWLRADPIRYFGDLRSDTLGAVVMLLAGVLMLYLWQQSGEQSRS